MEDLKKELENKSEIFDGLFKQREKIEDNMREISYEIMKIID